MSEQTTNPKRIEAAAETKATSDNNSYNKSNSHSQQMNQASNPASSVQTTPLSPRTTEAASPSSSYNSSTRSLNIPPPPPPISYDQSSQVSAASDPVMHERTSSSRGQNNLGVAQGVELLAQQQLNWERKKQLATAQFNAVYTTTTATATATAPPPSPNSNNQNKSVKDSPFSASSLTRKTLSTNRNQNTNNLDTNRRAERMEIGGPQDHNNGHFSVNEVDDNDEEEDRDDNGGVPTTVHIGDGDDVSESLKGEETCSAAPDKNKDMKRLHSIGNFLKKTPLKSTQYLKRNISDRFSSDPAADNGNANEEIEDDNDNCNASNSNSNSTAMKPILYGYLHKLGRHGKWQKRYFESDGTSLLYYKNSKRTTILATLDLLHVGSIQLDSSDPAGWTFMIEVKKRNYHLSAESKERARDWVISLNRVKEARMQIGGLKLIEPSFERTSGGGNSGINDGSRVEKQSDEEADLEDEQLAPRIVMVAPRKRLKGLGKDEFSEIENSLDGQNNKEMMTTSHPGGSGGVGSLLTNSKTAVDHALVEQANGVKVRWTKNRNSIQNLTRRLSRWAKRVTMVRCIVKDDVVHYGPHIQQKDDKYNIGEGETELNSQQRHEDVSFIDLGVPSYSSYPELYTESQVNSRQINFSEGGSLITSKESIDNSGYHSNMSNPSRMSNWKASQPHRTQEPSVQEEVGGGGSVQSSSGRVTPNNLDDGSGTCIT